MDLEARAREFLADLGAGRTEAVASSLADGAAFDLGGARVGREAFLRALARPGAVRDLAVKRNVTFAWTDAGVLVLSWDQDGRIAHAALHAPPG